MKRRLLALAVTLCVLLMMAAPVSAATYYPQDENEIPDKELVDAIFHDLGFSTWGSGYFGVSVTGAEPAPDSTIFEYMYLSGKMEEYAFEDPEYGMWGYELPYDTYIALVDNTFVNHGDMKAYLTERECYNAETGMVKWLTGGFGGPTTWVPLTYTVSGDYYYVTGVMVDYDYAPEDYDEKDEGKDWISFTTKWGVEPMQGMIHHPIIMTLEKGKNGYKILEYRENFYHVYNGVLYEEFEEEPYFRLKVSATRGAKVDSADDSVHFPTGFYGIGDLWVQVGEPLTYEITAEEGYEIERVTITNGFYLDELTPNEKGLYEIPATGDLVWLDVTAKRTNMVLGDVNNDGNIDSTDARLTLQYFVGSVKEDALWLDAADVNGSGEVDSTDARLILQKFVGSIEEFPVV